jgi:hypothetical protein
LENPKRRAPENDRDLSFQKLIWSHVMPFGVNSDPNFRVQKNKFELEFRLFVPPGQYGRKRLQPWPDKFDGVSSVKLQRRNRELCAMKGGGAVAEKAISFTYEALEAGQEGLRDLQYEITIEKCASALSHWDLTKEQS